MFGAFLLGACHGRTGGGQEHPGQDTTATTPTAVNPRIVREPGLQETFWKLSALYGKRPAPPLQGIAQIYLEFEDEKAIYGYGGCNTVTGTYLTSENMISFTTALRTDVTCPRKDEERQFLRMLGEVSHYRLTEDSLILLGTEEMRLATFVSERNLLFDR